MTGQEKSELESQFLLAINLNEPESLIATLHRAASRKVEDAAKGLITIDEGHRWRMAANALFEAEAKLNASQSPGARKLDALLAKWAGQAPPMPAKGAPHDGDPGAGEDAPLPRPAAIEGA